MSDIDITIQEVLCELRSMFVDFDGMQHKAKLLLAQAFLIGRSPFSDNHICPAEWIEAVLGTEEELPEKDLEALEDHPFQDSPFIRNENDLNIPETYNNM
jgi:hypothetical protein